VAHDANVDLLVVAKVVAVAITANEAAHALGVVSAVSCALRTRALVAEALSPVVNENRVAVARNTDTKVGVSAEPIETADTKATHEAHFAIEVVVTVPQAFATGASWRTVSLATRHFRTHAGGTHSTAATAVSTGFALAGVNIPVLAVVLHAHVRGRG
jgi:hypothetical protein